MGHNDRIDYEDNDFKLFLQQLVDNKHLEGVELGITKLVIDKGIESLSEKQQFVFQKEVLDEYVVEECKRCQISIPWSEMYEAGTDHGLCNYCWHMSDKED